MSRYLEFDFRYSVLILGCLVCEFAFPTCWMCWVPARIGTRVLTSTPYSVLYHIDMHVLLCLANVLGDREFSFSGLRGRLAVDWTYLPFLCDLQTGTDLWLWAAYQTCTVHTRPQAPVWSCRPSWNPVTLLGVSSAQCSVPSTEYLLPHCPGQSPTVLCLVLVSSWAMPPIYLLIHGKIEFGLPSRSPIHRCALVSSPSPPPLPPRFLVGLFAS